MTKTLCGNKEAGGPLQLGSGDVMACYVEPPKMITN